MAEYKLIIKPSALKEIDRTPTRIAQQLVKRIAGLALNPRPNGSKKLSAEEKYRVRQGDYRVVYRIDDALKLVEIVKVGHRSDIYR